MVGKTVLLYGSYHNKPTWVVKVDSFNTTHILGKFKTFEQNGILSKKAIFSGVEGSFRWEWLKRIDILTEEKAAKYA